MLSTLLPAILFIGIGLLFIDLVPLQETMMCATGNSSYRNATECPDAVFSQSYFDARARFRAAAKAANARLTSHVIVEEDGVAYTTDVAVIPGSEQSSNAVIHISGTHGVEGYVGSAIQTSLLQNWNSSRSTGPTAVFIHAVNPYGFAHARRSNEHNVDLNRNFFFSPEQWNAVRNRDPNIAGYVDFTDVFFPSEVPTLFERYAFLVRSLYYLVRYGMLHMKRAMVSAQYHHPEGPYYGGVGEEPSTEVLKAIAAQLKGFKKYVIIDVHSGLGPEGVDTLMVNTPDEALRVRNIFAAKDFVLESPEDKSGPSEGYDLTQGQVNLCPLVMVSGGVECHHVTEEFGTIPGVFVARALILENAAYQHARGSYIHHITQQWLRDAFYPQKISFKKSVLQRGVKMFDTAWEYLTQ